MCGLIGFSAKEGKVYNKEYIKLLMLHNSFERGLDASGVYTPKNGLIKDSVRASDFFNTKNFSNIKEDNIFIGHVRAATVGVKNKNNAHPFNYGKIILAHNGTLINYYSLLNGTPKSMVDFNVDSQVLTYLMDYYYNPTVLTKFEGAAAVIFADTDEPDVIYCYRNKERPLYRGTNEDGMYLSSIENSLKYIGCVNIKDCCEDILYKIRNGRIEKMVKIKNTVKERTKKSTFLGVEDYISKWVLLETEPGSYYSSKGNLIKGKYYYITNSTNTNYEVKVLDEDGKIVEVPKHCFDSETANIQEGDIVKAVCDLCVDLNKPTEKSVCKKGDKLYVVEISGKDYTVINLKNNSKFIAKTSSFYKILEDVSTLKIKQNNEELELLKPESKKEIIEEIEITDEEVYFDIYSFIDELKTSYKELEKKLLNSKKDTKIVLESLKNKIELGEKSIQYMLEEDLFDEDLDDKGIFVLGEEIFDRTRNKYGVFIKESVEEEDMSEIKYLDSDVIYIVKTSGLEKVTKGETLCLTQ